MLNNKDFAKLLSQPDSSGKVRYDLNQIKQWDKQNEAQLKKKSFGPSSTNKAEGSQKGVDVTDDTEPGGYKYVDRAEERRKQDASSESQQLEVIAASLNYEQSKFLGGDEAHTHLVKGLDYALLRKSREKAPPGNTTSASASSGSDIGGTGSEIKKSAVKPNTTLGLNIQHVLFGDRNTPVGQSGQSHSDAGKAFIVAAYAPSSSSSSSVPLSKNTGIVGLSASTKSSGGSLLGRQGYEFDTDPANHNDLPTVVKRSKLEWEERAEMSYTLPDALLNRLGEALRLHAENRLKRKKRESEQTAGQGQLNTTSSNTNAAAQSSTVIAKETKKLPIVDDIYGDIFEGIGKYEPVGALSSSSSTSASASASASAPASAVKTIFSEIFESSQALRPPAPTPVTKVKSAAGGDAAGIYAGLISGFEGTAAPATIASAGRDKGPASKVIHRDIFLGAGDEEGAGTTHKKIRTAQGDLVLAKRGDYEFEPDDDDAGGAYGSDDEEGDGGDGDGARGGGGKGKKGKSTTGNGNGHGGGGSNGPRSSNHPSGLNRAARRALANGAM